MLSIFWGGFDLMIEFDLSTSFYTYVVRLGRPTWYSLFKAMSESLSSFPFYENLSLFFWPKFAISHCKWFLKSFSKTESYSDKDKTWGFSGPWTGEFFQLPARVQIENFEYVIVIGLYRQRTFFPRLQAFKTLKELWMYWSQILFCSYTLAYFSG